MRLGGVAKGLGVVLVLALGLLGATGTGSGIILLPPTELEIGIEGEGVLKAPLPAIWAELTVCPEGPPACDFATIQEAIKAAPAGTTIYIGEGVYQENLDIQKNLRLIGAGVNRTIVKADIPLLPVLLIYSNGPIEVEVKGMAITGSGIRGILVGGNAKAFIKNIKVSEYSKEGISVGESAQLNLAEVLILYNAIGLLARGTSKIQMQCVQIINSFFSGMIVEGSTKVEIRDSVIQESLYEYGGTGLTIRAQAEAILQSVRIMDNFGSGLEVADAARATISDSQIVKNKLGLGITNSAYVILSNVYIAGNRSHGVIVDEQSQTELWNSEITGNGGWGIAATLIKCGFNSDRFTGRVMLTNTGISGNYKGQICLP